METKTLNRFDLLNDLKKMVGDRLDFAAAEVFANQVFNLMGDYISARAETAEMLAELADQATHEIDLMDAGNKMYESTPRSMANKVAQIAELRATCEQHEHTLKGFEYFVGTLTRQEFDIFAYCSRNVR